MGRTINTIKYDRYIGKTYRGYTLTSWQQSEDHKHIIYTMQKPTGETKKLQYSLIRQELEAANTPIRRNVSMSEIQNGMVCQLKNNALALVTNSGLIDLEKGNLISSRTQYQDNLRHLNHDLDIIKIYDSFNLTNLLYERPRFKLSDKEKEYINAALLLGFKYIFKNKNQDVYVSNIKPEKGGVDWVFDRPKYITRLSSITSNMFEFVKWSDDEALLIAGLL
jgi:hypothetical protein